LIRFKEDLDMVTMFARHTVSDYSNWKRIYDDVGSLRKEKGVVGASVYRAVSDPNSITVEHQFNNLDAAKGFADSAELRAAMDKGGVKGKPEVWFAEEVEHTSN
jgi:hypothetical protein